MRRPGQILVALGALFALASAFLHGFVARPVVLGRLPGGPADATWAAVNAAWILGSAAVAALAAIALLAIPRLGRGPTAGIATAIAGLFFLAYGAWGYSYRQSSHYIGFMVTGLLLLAGAWLGSKDRSGP